LRATVVIAARAALAEHAEMIALPVAI